MLLENNLIHASDFEKAINGILKERIDNFINTNEEDRIKEEGEHINKKLEEFINIINSQKNLRGYDSLKKQWLEQTLKRANQYKTLIKIYLES